MEKSVGDNKKDAVFLHLFSLERVWKIIPTIEIKVFSGLPEW